MVYVQEGIAAVVLEPVVGNSGFIPPTKEFLQGLRALCDKHKSVLVFDEVMTGFRISYGGAQVCCLLTNVFTVIECAASNGLAAVSKLAVPLPPGLSFAYSAALMSTSCDKMAFAGRRRTSA